MLKLQHTSRVFHFCFEVFDFKYFEHDVSYHLIANINTHVMRREFESKFEKRFYLFFCVLITNEHRMHVQKSAEKNAFSSYEMTRYSRIFHTLIILSLRFKSELSSRIVSVEVLFIISVVFVIFVVFISNSCTSS